MKLNNYIESEFVLIIQDDGHIVNPQLWDDQFLNYDYIGAPWPSSRKWLKRFKKYDYYDVVKNNMQENRIGNGGFSLRSKKFLEFCSQFENCNGVPEDIFFCLLNYQEAKKNDINFAPFELAYKFSAEHSFRKLSNKYPISKSKFNFHNHFGWHGKRFLNSDKLMNLKYEN